MTTTVIVKANHGWPVQVHHVDPVYGRQVEPLMTVEPNSEAMFYVHSGADLHIHEVQPAVPAGAETSSTSHQGLPVEGYRPQNEEAVALVNLNKRAEEHVLRILDKLAARDDIDKRWLAIGRTEIEKGFMAVNRAVFQPGRVDL